MNWWRSIIVNLICNPFNLSCWFTLQIIWMTIGKSPRVQHLTELCEGIPPRGSTEEVNGNLHIISQHLAKASRAG